MEEDPVCDPLIRTELDMEGDPVSITLFEIEGDAVGLIVNQGVMERVNLGELLMEEDAELDGDDRTDCVRLDDCERYADSVLD